MNPLRETISWLKTKVQEDFFPYPQACFPDPMTEKQKRLITILEIVQVEKVKLHLMFGIIALFADQLMKMAT